MSFQMIAVTSMSNLKYRALVEEYGALPFAKSKS